MAQEKSTQDFLVGRRIPEPGERDGSWSWTVEEHRAFLAGLRGFTRLGER